MMASMRERLRRLSQRARSRVSGSSQFESIDDDDPVMRGPVTFGSDPLRSGSMRYPAMTGAHALAVVRSLKEGGPLVKVPPKTDDIPESNAHSLFNSFMKSTSTGPRYVDECPDPPPACPPGQSLVFPRKQPHFRAPTLHVDISWSASADLDATAYFLDANLSLLGHISSFTTSIFGGAAVHSGDARGRLSPSSSSRSLNATSSHAASSSRRAPPRVLERVSFDLAALPSDVVHCCVVARRVSGAMQSAAPDGAARGEGGTDDDKEKCDAEVQLKVTRWRPDATYTGVALSNDAEGDGGAVEGEGGEGVMYGGVRCRGVDWPPAGVKWRAHPRRAQGATVSADLAEGASVSADGEGAAVGSPDALGGASSGGGGRMFSSGSGRGVPSPRGVNLGGLSGLRQSHSGAFSPLSTPSGVYPVDSSSSVGRSPSGSVGGLGGRTAASGAAVSGRSLGLSGAESVAGGAMSIGSRGVGVGVASAGAAAAAAAARGGDPPAYTPPTWTALMAALPAFPRDHAACVIVASRFGEEVGGAEQSQQRPSGRGVANASASKGRDGGVGLTMGGWKVRQSTQVVDVRELSPSESARTVATALSLPSAAIVDTSWVNVDMRAIEADCSALWGKAVESIGMPTGGGVGATLSLTSVVEFVYGAPRLPEHALPQPPSGTVVRETRRESVGGPDNQPARVTDSVRGSVDSAVGAPRGAADDRRESAVDSSRRSSATKPPPADGPRQSGLTIPMPPMNTGSNDDDDFDA